jgi:hypothetical protein
MFTINVGTVFCGEEGRYLMSCICYIKMYFEKCTMEFALDNVIITFISSTYGVAFLNWLSFMATWSTLPYLMGIRGSRREPDDSIAGRIHSNRECNFKWKCHEVSHPSTPLVPNTATTIGEQKLVLGSIERELQDFWGFCTVPLFSGSFCVWVSEWVSEWVARDVSCWVSFSFDQVDSADRFCQSASRAPGRPAFTYMNSGHHN